MKNMILKNLNDKATDNFDWKNWVNEIRNDFYNSGCKAFEISGRYTKTGNPVVINYNYLPRLVK